MNLTSKRKAWADQQRRNFRDGKLSKKQIELLQKHDFRFGFIRKEKSKTNKALKVLSNEDRKNKILEIAKSGGARPIQKKHDLGSSLAAYVCCKSDMYDFKFDKTIRELRPDWFDFPEVVDDETKKRELLLLAQKMEKKPKREDNSLIHAFDRFCDPKQKAYDLQFYNQIKSINPDWFVKRSETSNNKKNALLLIARNGLSKPIAGKHVLGSYLKSILNKKQKGYDSSFDKEIRELRPDWFFNGNKYCGKIEDFLLKCSIIEKVKENLNLSDLKDLGLLQSLRIFTQEGSSYDPIFSREIRKLRSSWFLKEENK